MAGDVVADQVWRELGGFSFNTCLLTAAGVDAVVLTPDWLADGPEQARSYVDACRFAPLCANIADAGGVPIGYPWVVKRCGPASIGLSAVWSAIEDPGLQQRGIELYPAAARARRVLPAIRGQAAAAVLVVSPPLAGAAAGYDVAVGDSTQRWAVGRIPGRDSVVLLTCQIDNSGVVETVSQQTLSLADVAARADVKATADSLRRLADSTAATVVAVVDRAVTASTATQKIARRVLLNWHADCFVSDALLVNDDIAAGPLTIGRMLEILTEPAACVIVEATGAELRQLLADVGLQCVWRSNTSRPNLVVSRKYRVVMTAGFMGRHPWVPSYRQERLSLPLWRLAAEAMGTGQESRP